MYKYIKRALDIILSFVGLVALSPVLLVVVIAIKLDSKGPVLFKQKRVGKNEKLFRIYKFRTMKIDTPKYVPTSELDGANDHITRVGAFLRKTSLDEIPQLFNVLRGEMSLVGPRPLIKEEWDVIEAREKYGANSILPGITGWAQIHGRDTIGLEEKAALDGYYAQHMSLWMDIKCLVMTVLCVISAKDVVEGKQDENQ